MNDLTKKKFSKFFQFYRAALIVFFIILSSFNHLKAQEVDEYYLKSVFILKIPLFVEWPENASYRSNGKDFIFSIIGDDPFNNKLQNLIKSQNAKIKNLNIVINKIKKIEEIEGSDILFICSSEKYNLTKIMNYVKNKPILTISDSKVYTDKGVMINIYVDGSNLAIDVNLQKSNESKIYISSKFLANAKRVIK